MSMSMLMLAEISFNGALLLLDSHKHMHPKTQCPYEISCLGNWSFWKQQMVQNRGSSLRRDEGLLIKRLSFREAQTREDGINDFEDS